MKVFFINYGGYSGNCGVHIHFLANALVAQGVDCFVALPEETHERHYFGEPRYSILPFSELILLMQQRREFFEDAIFHAWTPREAVRSLTEVLSKLTKRPYLVHLEDNEEHILEACCGVPFADLARLCETEELPLGIYFSHPVYYRQFLAGAAGVTCIVKELKEFVPEGVPSQVFWPACEEAFFRLPATPNQKVRDQLCLDAQETILTYPGGFNAVNTHVRDALYLSLALLNERGYRVRLIRAGVDLTDMSPEVANAYERFVINVGNVAATALPALVGAANIVVQPGQPGPYDDYRFPSKLPLFLASCRPLLTASTNVGQYLQHEEHCLMLKTSTAEDIADNVIRLIENPALARTLGINGRAFARRYFSWDKSASRVKAFYERIVADWKP